MRHTLALCLLGSLITVETARGDPATAPAPAPYAQREVVIETGVAGVRLAGTLMVPGGPGPHPAALLLTGDGGHLRDQVISGSPMFGMIADHLTRAGIAVLRVDDRGVGESSGPSAERSTIAELAGDARACVAFLRAQTDVNPHKIGLIGHSRGAITAPMVAAGDARLKFLVLLAPPAVPGGEIWVRQKLDGLKRHGADPAVMAPVEQQLRRLVEFVKGGTNDDETFYRIGHDFVAAHGMEEAQINRELIDKLIGGLRTEPTRFFFSYDPAAALAKLQTPTLAVSGSADDQVRVEQNVPPLAAALARAGNADFTICIVPDQDHFFLVHEGRRRDKHVFGKMQVSPELLQQMSEWIRLHVR